MKDALVLVSIVLGVAITFELEHLNKVLRSPKVRWHWAQPLFALFVLLSIISFWWGAASFKQESLTLGEFLPVMFQLIMLALLAAASFPDRVPDEGIDLAQYYQDSRVYQWTLVNLYFWTIHIGFMIRTAQQTSTLKDFAIIVGPDTFGALVIFGMLFARKWWQVGVGFAIISLAPIVWLSRTLG